MQILRPHPGASALLALNPRFNGDSDEERQVNFRKD
jgi:hypothetical protein